MTTQLATQPTASIVPTSGDNFELSAQNPEEMVQCHHAAIEWSKRKIAIMQGEARELQKAYDKARERKWQSGTLKRHWELAEKRVVFYQKMLAAFEAGYYIVPNFPVTLFAIRTDKPTPKRMWARLRHASSQDFEQSANLLPVGQGKYQNPQPVVEQKDLRKDDKGNETLACQATDWADLDFPANMARVHVMEAATKAMDAKIFDEVGFLPQDYKRNPDPLLIGRIIRPDKPKWYGDSAKVSFIIAWHINTATL